MKANYKNWVPLGLIVGCSAASAVAVLILLLSLFTNFWGETAKLVISIISGLIFAVLLGATLFFINLYRTFSYNGKKQFARRIIEHVSDYVTLPDGGVGLDVGCGSGALTIACAKKNPKASMVGLDRWGKEYASFSKNLCMENGKAEGVEQQVSFVQGDACKLDYPDQNFDTITSNYCYHNIPGKNRQEIIIESLRVLKKGGIFAIHDEFTQGKYGDIQELVKKLQNMGYEKVVFQDTSKGLFMTEKEAGILGLKGSGLLYGKK